MVDLTDPRHVLLVDDEPTTQQIVEHALRRGIPGARVTCASNGAEALRALSREPIDLLITALVIPVVDGLELVRHLVNRRLAVPVLVVRGPGAPEELSAGASAIEFLAEPLEVDRLVRRARELLAPGDGSRERGVGLRDLVQFVARAQRTCALRATLGEAQGLMHFAGGALVDAGLGDARGEAAAREILGWRGATVTIDLLPRVRSVTIQTSLGALLRAAIRGDDEPVGPGPAPVAWEGPGASERIARALAEAMNIEGALGAAMAAWELDHTLGALGTLGPPQEVVISGNCRVMRALLMTMTRLGMRTSIDDVLITLDEQLHILVPLPRHDELFLYLVVDRARGNLALTRHRVRKIVGDLAFG